MCVFPYYGGYIVVSLVVVFPDLIVKNDVYEKRSEEAQEDG